MAKGRQRRANEPQVRRHRGRRRRSRRGIWLWLLTGMIALALLFGAALWISADRLVIHPRTTALQIEPYSSRSELAQRLMDNGVIDQPSLFVVYWLVFHPFAKVEPNDHLIEDGISLRQLLDRLTRSSSRPRVRVTLPEGFTLFQVAERLEAKGICAASAFELAAQSPELMNRLGVPAGTAEGFLFPDTYDLYLDSASTELVRRLVDEGEKRFNDLLAKESEAATRLQQKFGFRPYEIIILASIVEKEAHQKAEQATIAGVFLNRLIDDTFLPHHALQSDPTAAYGCLVNKVGSCKDFDGKVTPEILRDATNSYNTYRHPGLPPGPVSNPGLAAVLAVLHAAETPYYFFVADGHGGHVFSRTLKEHEAAIGSVK